MADDQKKSDVARADASQSRRPVSLFDAMRSDLDRVFDRFERGWPGFGRMGGFDFPTVTRGMSAALDVRDEGNQLVIEADLPGMEEKDVSVTLSNGILTIKGERKSEREEKKDNYHIAERSFGSFQRSLQLPDGIDDSKVEAKFDKGVLHIVAPKRPEAASKERKIEIRKA
ncbi:MAG: Hsp20/alpha crystallin family protein [Hyphomicrobiaceae bacterium]|nr:Hsp20/alpha crystallin family protein [Hyphomicrobiaceae bacterium]